MINNVNETPETALKQCLLLDSQPGRPNGTSQKANEGGLPPRQNEAWNSHSEELDATEKDRAFANSLQPGRHADP